MTRPIKSPLFLTESRFTIEYEIDTKWLVLVDKRAPLSMIFETREEAEECIRRRARRLCNDITDYRVVEIPL